MHSFAWKGTLYSVGTRVRFKKDFIKIFRWMGEEICEIGIFLDTYFNGNDRMFQFNKYCLNEHITRHFYPGSFSLTELELQDAIEEIIKPYPKEIITARKPPFAEKQLSKDYKGKRTFFEHEGKYYGAGSKIYITDSFIDYYYHKTGKRLTKRIMFTHSVVINGERKYCISCINSMKRPGLSDYGFFFSLSEEEFFIAIEVITECCAIKYKDTNEPVVFIFWITAFILIGLSCLIFVNSAPLIVLILWGLYKVRKIFLRQ
jgi:hypothetical protein